MTSERVRDLTYSVQQDSDSKHVDVHLVQLKVRKVSGLRSIPDRSLKVAAGTRA